MRPTTGMGRARNAAAMRSRALPPPFLPVIGVTLRPALVQEIDAADIRMGMRVQAVWAPKEEWDTSLSNIRYFKPLDEPDVPFDDFKEHL